MKKNPSAVDLFHLGDVIELVELDNFDYYWEDLLKEEMDVFYWSEPDDDSLPSYRCRFHNPNRVHSLYDQLEDVSDVEFSRLMAILQQEKLTIVGYEVLSKKETVNQNKVNGNA